MMTRLSLLLGVVIVIGCASASAQTVAADRFRFNTGPCMIRSGSGSPEGVQVGNVCDQWHRTDSPYGVYTKRSASGTSTGWLLPASTDLTDTTNLARLDATNTFSATQDITATANTVGALAAFNSGVGNGTAGVQGIADASTAAGVSGSSVNGSGVKGTSASGYGVEGASTSGWDFYGNGLKTFFSGNVGIGTETGLSKLSINGGLHVGGDSDAGDNNAIIDGTLGVTGVTTLTGLLNANGGIAVDTSNFTVSGTTGAVGLGNQATVQWNASAAQNGYAFLGTTETSTGTGSMMLQAGAGSGSSGGGLTLFGQAHATRIGSVVAGIGLGSGGRFAVNTTGIAGAIGTDIFTVLSGGNVGIGTTAPQALLVVSNVGAAGIEFAPASGSIFGYNRSTVAYAPLVMNGSTLSFGIAGSARLTIDASGNVDVPNGPIRANTTGIVVSSFGNGLNIGTWDSVGYLASPSNYLALGGYRASQWTGVEFYGAAAKTATIDATGLGVNVVPTRRLHIAGTTITQFIAAQTTPPTCGTNCGTSPSITGSDTFMTVTLGTTPASGFVITFSGAWPAAPACVGAMATTGMVVGKLPLTIVTTTTTITVVTNGTAPSTGNKYHFHCGGPTG